MLKKITILMAIAIACPSLLATAQDQEAVTVPFSEDFASSDGASSFTVLDLNDDGRTWSFNNSKKAMRYRGHSTNAANDWLVTPFITMDANKHYELSYTTFVLNNTSGVQNMTTHFDQSDDATTLEQIAQNTNFNNEDKIVTKVLLNPSTNGDYRIAFHAVSDGGQGNFFVDDILVREVYSQDLAISLSGDVSVKAGEAAELVANVANVGYEVATGYTVELYANGKLVDTHHGASLPAGEDTDITFYYNTKVTDDAEQTLQAVVVMDGDADTGNNTSDELAITLRQPSYPTVTDLVAENKAGAIELKWSEVTPENGPVTDSFEDYASWVISGIGDWLTVDADKARTMNLAGVEFPYMGKPMAYMTFVPEELGFEEYYPAHTGRQCLFSFDAVSHDAPQGSDDWLISPLLSGSAQTIQFWHRAMYPGEAEDKCEVLYSTTDRKPQSFIKVGDTMVSPGEWTEAQVSIPDGAKYFAIRCVSDPDEIAFMLDDVTYEPAPLVVASYNIYRDGELIGQVDATGNSTNSYIDSSVTLGDHSYQVSVVYTIGESSLSQAASATYTSIVEIIDSANSRFDIYTIDGRLVRQNTLSTQGLKGIYIVNNRKIILK